MLYWFKFLCKAIAVYIVILYTRRVIYCYMASRYVIMLLYHVTAVVMLASAFIADLILVGCRAGLIRVILRMKLYRLLLMRSLHSSHCCSADHGAVSINAAPPSCPLW